MWTYVDYVSIRLLIHQDTQVWSYAMIIHDPWRDPESIHDPIHNSSILIISVIIIIHYPFIQWPFQGPKLEESTIHKGYVRPMWGNIPTKYSLSWYAPFQDLEIPIDWYPIHPPDSSMIARWPRWQHRQRPVPLGALFLREAQGHHGHSIQFHAPPGWWAVRVIHGISDMMSLW